jgi:dihydrofolate reductase
VAASPSRGYVATVRKLTYFVAATLDGFIAAPDGSFDFFPVSDEYHQHVVEHYPETLPSHVRSALGVTAVGTRFDTVVSGFATYDVGPRTGFPSPYSHLQQYVVSTRLSEAPHPDVRLISRDPVAAVRRLKGEDGLDIYLCGGGKLAGALAGDIDELIVKRSPISIGAGIAMFEGSFEPQRWQLVDDHTIDIGVTFTTYRRAS